MAKGILGKKIGMTQIFDENGVLVPVTVVDVEGNVVLQQKTVEVDGYVATQVGFETKREKLSNKPELGHVKKANSAPKRFVKEIRFDALKNELTALEVGSEVKVDLFQSGEDVDVTGTSKGKGYAGAIKRHNQSRGPMTHGSMYHRAPGSMGAIKGNMKGKNLPGHMGSETVTVQNLKIVAVDVENQLLLISGSVPGPKKGYVVVKSAIKKGN
ncbi:50S ribosomal protein L3 [Acholeplasma oculi]|uniref:Large ribosomal subunit protein uL3 n=1 Tax=Acholeplasma oculi TaxID=35623 RepID=A0A061AK81_9MOLU|nr:50S ribosomal protein L3 [Acholeplasma oculi]SKC40026.1 large subunit ribosomal protein L3 [Acholeplasma oculi]SUT92064.1 50S ribosomal protein L3 [Acholeplasma oculi]HLS99939.1 50S ribosomal protein L3 [Acholeplasma sp.]